MDSDDQLAGWLRLAREVEPLFGPMVDDPGFRDGLKRALLEERAIGWRRPDGALSGGIIVDRAANDIAWFAVEKASQGKGIGRKLLAAALARLDPLRPVSVTTFAASVPAGEMARRLYERFGFQDEKPAGVNPAGIEIAVMVRRCCAPVDHAPGPAPVIVQAEETDAPAILALQRLAYQTEAELYQDWSIPPLRETEEEFVSAFPELRVLKAAHGDTIVGSVRGALRDGTCEVGRLIVDPVWRRQGIGSRLLVAIEEEFPDAARFEIFTGTLSRGNIRLYERHGYRACRTQEAAPGLTFVFMEKARASR